MNIEATRITSPPAPPIPRHAAALPAILTLTLLASTAFAFTPCGPNTCPRGQVCCDHTCGYCAPEGQTCELPHCGLPGREVDGFTPIVPSHWPALVTNSALGVSVGWESGTHLRARLALDEARTHALSFTSQHFGGLLQADRLMFAWSWSLPLGLRQLRLMPMAQIDLHTSLVPGLDVGGTVAAVGLGCLYGSRGWGASGYLLWHLPPYAFTTRRGWEGWDSRALDVGVLLGYHGRAPMRLPGVYVGSRIRRWWDATGSATISEAFTALAWPAGPGLELRLEFSWSMWAMWHKVLERGNLGLAIDWHFGE